MTPPIFIYPDKKVLQFGSKPVFRFLTQVLKIKVGEIPEIVDKFDNVNKKYFIAGVFDAEGYVCKTRYRITISQAKPEFLEKVKFLAKSIGIKFAGPTTHTTHLGTWYTIRIDNKEGILRFANLIGSFHVDKLTTLRKKSFTNS